MPIEAGNWYSLHIATRGRLIRAYLDGVQVVEYETDRGLNGYVGLWTKADSVTLFDSLAIDDGNESCIIMR